MEERGGNSHYYYDDDDGGPTTAQPRSKVGPQKSATGGAQARWSALFGEQRRRPHKRTMCSSVWLCQLFVVVSIVAAGQQGEPEPSPTIWGL